jgi:uncharacterized protein (TIGR03086 family)
MSEISDRYRRRAAAFAGRIDAVPAGSWTNQTPCEDWDARQLVQHVVDTSALFLGFIDSPHDPFPAASDDPALAFGAASSAVLAALEDPAQATATYKGFAGETTFEAGVDGFLSVDLVVHGWDLARATGLDELIDAEDVRLVRAAAGSWGDMIRGPGAFGAEVEPPSDADEQAKLLAFLGRHP